MRLPYGVGTDEPLDLFCCRPCAGGGEGYRPYFENYTVDASIFEMTFGHLVIDDLKDHYQFRDGLYCPIRFFDETHVKSSL